MLLGMLRAVFSVTEEQVLFFNFTEPADKVGNFPGVLLRDRVRKDTNGSMALLPRMPAALKDTSFEREGAGFCVPVRKPEVEIQKGAFLEFFKGRKPQTFRADVQTFSAALVTRRGVQVIHVECFISSDALVPGGGLKEPYDSGEDIRHVFIYGSLPFFYSRLFPEMRGIPGRRL